METALTSWVDYQAAVTPSDREAFALYAESCDLALLQDVLEAGEVLYLPHKLALKVLSCAHTL